MYYLRTNPYHHSNAKQSIRSTSKVYSWEEHRCVSADIFMFLKSNKELREIKIPYESN
jgi:hypothetical protein